MLTERQPTQYPALRGIIDRFEGQQAIIVLDGGTELGWPQDKLPAHSKEGTVFWLRLQTDPEAEADRRKLAKRILNEILGGTKDS
jgi:hypothetical protein